jgi:hypothetical protein
VSAKSPGEVAFEAWRGALIPFAVECRWDELSHSGRAAWQAAAQASMAHPHCIQAQLAADNELLRSDLTRLLTTLARKERDGDGGVFCVTDTPYVPIRSLDVAGAEAVRRVRESGGRCTIWRAVQAVEQLQGVEVGL